MRPTLKRLLIAIVALPGASTVIAEIRNG